MSFKPPATEREWAIEIDALQHFVRWLVARYPTYQDRILINDLVSRTVERAQRLLSQGRYQGHTPLRCWLRCIAINILKEELGRISRAGQVLPYDDESPRVEPPASAGPDPLRDERIRSAVSRLQARPLQIVLDRYVEGRSLGEISEHRGIPLSTVKYTHVLALKELRERITLEEQVPLDHAVRWIWDSLGEGSWGPDAPDRDRRLRQREALCLCVFSAQRGIHRADRIVARADDDPHYRWAAGRAFSERHLKSFLREYGPLINEIVRLLAAPGK